MFRKLNAKCQIKKLQAICMDCYESIVLTVIFNFNSNIFKLGDILNVLINTYSLIAFLILYRISLLKT